jgi:hypothetical protein
MRHHTIRNRQPREAANAAWVAGSSGEVTTKAARSSRWARTPLYPSAHIVQAGQALPMLWITISVSLSPKSCDRRTGPSVVAKL